MFPDITTMMDTQAFWIILLIYIYSVYNVENSIVQPNRQMSNKKAKEKCAQTGASLVSYASVKAKPSAPDYLTQLVDGESAWIKGYAKLSPFLAWHGCFNTTHKDMKIAGLYALAIEEKSLYLCSQQCLPYKYPYMGMKNKTCYCFYRQQGHLIQYAAVNDSLCSLPCDNNVVDSCGGHSFVSVYSIVEFGSMHWAQHEPSKRQCVYVRIRSRFDLHTVSCHTLPPYMVNGFICMDSVHSRLKTINCTKANSYCIFDEPATRREAYTSCIRRHGKLAVLSSELEVPQLMTKTNFKYWISVYRTFGISERYIKNKTICLAAVRVNTTLYLEPDDCSEQKHYLCEQKIITHSSNYSYKTSNTRPINTIPTTTGDISTTQDLGYVSPFAYIVPSILVAILLVIIVVIVLYRRRKKHANRLPHQSEDTYITPQHGTINGNNSEGRLDDGAMNVEEMERNEGAPYAELTRVRNDPEYSELVDTANNEAEYIELQ